MDEKNIRVLMVCTVPTGKSGIPNVIFNLMESMNKDRLSLGYVSINKPDEFYCARLKNIGANLHYIERKLSNPLAYVLSLAKVAKNYDIIHVHGNSATMVLEMIAAKIAGIKVRICHCHSTTCSKKTIDKYSRWLFYLLCNGRLACGKEAGKWLYRNRTFRVVNNAISTANNQFDSNKRLSIRSKLGLTEKDFLIGHIGNFVEAKNHKFLIKVFSELLKSRPDTKLILLGDGQLMEESIKYIAEKGVKEHVIITGSVPSPSDYMQAMDMVVMPSIYEGLPLTLVEEQANGLSILASDVITPDANMAGLITYKSLDEGVIAWSEKISEMISEVKHNTETSELAIGRIKDAGYDITVVAQQLKAFYLKQYNILNQR